MISLRHYWQLNHFYVCQKRTKKGIKHSSLYRKKGILFYFWGEFDKVPCHSFLLFVLWLFIFFSPHHKMFKINSLPICNASIPQSKNLFSKKVKGVFSMADCCEWMGRGDDVKCSDRKWCGNMIRYRAGDSYDFQRTHTAHEGLGDVICDWAQYLGGWDFLQEIENQSSSHITHVYIHNRRYSWCLPKSW